MLPIRIPEPAGSIVDFVTSEDKRYFEQHPQARFYDRSPHPQELWPETVGTKNVLMRVYQITPGVRIRRPFPEGGKPDKFTTGLVKSMRKAYARGELKAVR